MEKCTKNYADYTKNALGLTIDGYLRVLVHTNSERSIDICAVRTFCRSRGAQWEKTTIAIGPVPLKMKFQGRGARGAPEGRSGESCMEKNLRLTVVHASR